MTWSDAEHALVGIIADDLTGANATGILLRRRGFRTASLTSMDWPSDGLAGYDCVSISTESRAFSPGDAYRQVAAATQMILAHQGRPLAKRIDSTLRGNLGPEIEAVLDLLGPESVAVVTAAFPSSGRTTRDGFHYVDGTLVAQTPVRHDPLCPVTESHVPTVLGGQTSLRIGHLSLEVARSGAHVVTQELLTLHRAGCRLIAADAETDADIEALGQGMALSGLTAIAADPGPLTAAYVGALMTHGRQRVMVVAGSVTPNTRAQLAQLEATFETALVTVDSGALAKGGAESESEVERAVAALTNLPPEPVVIGVRTNELMSLPDRHAAEAIAAGFAEIAARTLKVMPDLGGLYTTGGDITLAVCRRLGSRAISLDAEVIPLGVAGRLLGGQQPGLPIVTKGGLVGGPDAAVKCVAHIFKEVQNHG